MNLFTNDENNISFKFCHFYRYYNVAKMKSLSSGTYYSHVQIHHYTILEKLYRQIQFQINIVLFNKNKICVWNVWNIQWLIYSLLVFNATLNICLLFHDGLLFVDGEESWSAQTELLTFGWETVKHSFGVELSYHV